MPVDEVSEWAVAMMERLGGPGAGLAIALENLFPPLPSEVILPLAGFAASRGDLHYLAAVVWTTIGSLVGAWALYGIGAALGPHRTKALMVKLPLVQGSDVDKADAFFDRHGGKAVFFGRMVPVFRSFISIPAGVRRMSVIRFSVLTLVGSGIWNVGFVTAGFFLGQQWHLVERYTDILTKIVLGVIVVAVIMFVVRGIRRRRAQPARSDRA
jgi:membrane protein DedA with SNARE-associated domain